MVQQNLVSYIITQMRQGKKLEDINKFLLQAGYNAAEVESSVQYVINTQTNPQVAEQQRIEQLAGYIQKQLSAGYDQKTIANFLITRGYPYYEVNSALQQATIPKKEMKIEHKLFIFAILAMLVTTSALTFFYFKAYTQIGVGMPEQLLDVETEKLTTLVQPGGELTFQVNLMSFGSGQRYDVLLEYKLIDRDTDVVVLEKMETVALSTTVEKIEKFEIPQDMRPGKYLLRVDAIYQDFTATSGFVFDVVPLEQAEKIREEVKEMLPEENKTEEEVVSEVPTEQDVVPIPPAPTQPVVAPPEGEIWYEGKTRQQALELVKAVSVREPERAISMCNEFTLGANRQACIMTLAEFKQNPAYCESLTDDRSKDNCYVQIALNTGMKGSCENIHDSNVRQSCELMLIAKGAEKPGGQIDADTMKEKLFGVTTKPVTE